LSAIEKQSDITYLDNI